MWQFTQKLSSDQKGLKDLYDQTVAAIKIHSLLNEEDTTETVKFIEKVLNLFENCQYQRNIWKHSEK